eukprot:2207704-Alexandrium_andersonii.AAC.1
MFRRWTNKGSRRPNAETCRAAPRAREGTGSRICHRSVGPDPTRAPRRTGLRGREPLRRRPFRAKH